MEISEMHNVHGAGLLYFKPFEKPVHSLEEYAKELELVKDSNNHFVDILQDCYKIVLNFIKRKARILVGSMAIDYALRLHKDKLHTITKIDYDIISPDHYLDAYELGEELAKKYDHISIIGAKHVSTMRVRYLFMEVADITYVPKVIYDKIQTLQYDGIVLRHPLYQMMDQFRAIRSSLEGPPMEPILGERIAKDIKRLALLSKYYDIEVKSLPKSTMHEVQIDKSDIEPFCLAGYPAVIYWMKKLLVESNDELKITDKVVINMPEDYQLGLLTDTDEIAGFVLDSTYNPYLDKISSRLLGRYKEIPTEFYYLSNERYIVSHDKIKILGFAGVMVWLIWRYLAYSDQLCGAIFKTMRQKFLNNIDLITSDISVYGNVESETHDLLIGKQRANMKGKKIEQLVPRNAYLEKGDKVKIESFQFDISTSPLFQIDGSRTLE